MTDALNGIDVDALNATRDALRAEPALAQVGFSLNSTWLSGCHQSATTGSLTQNGAVVESRTATYTMESDEPAALLGTDKAVSPAEYVLQALAACYAVTFATNAAAHDIELSSLRTELEIDFDLQGFLNLNPDVRAGAQGIRVVVHAESPNASRDQLKKLVSDVERFSPIRDTLANGVNIVTKLA